MNPCPHQIGRIMAVMEAAFDPAYGEAWNRRQVSDALCLPSTHALVISAAGELLGTGPDPREPAGFVLTRHAADEEELLLIAVHPVHRRKRLGETLIKHLVLESRSRGVARIFLEMRRGNPAVELYRKVGFQPIGERANYYRASDGQRIDAITFSLTIST